MSRLKGLSGRIKNCHERGEKGQKGKDEAKSKKGEAHNMVSKFLIPASLIGCCKSTLQQQKSSPGRKEFSHEREKNMMIEIRRNKK